MSFNSICEPGFCLAVHSATMIGRKMIGVSTLICLVTLSFGCEKLSSTAKGTSPVESQRRAVLPIETAIRIHWLGKMKIVADTNATSFMQIWELPETVKLEAQTLDKLSSAPWRLLLRQTNQASAGLLRPLLDDLVAEESYVEIRHSTNASNPNEEMVLAVRLSDQRAALWQTNLAAAFESLTGIHPADSQLSTLNSQQFHGWSLRKHHAPDLIEFVRAGEWVILGAAQDHNTLLDETMARIERDHAPFAASATNFWLDVNFNVSRKATAHSDLPAMFPEISLTMMGSDHKVLTRGRLNFSGAVPVVSESWNIPTNFFGGDLSSFTALRAGTQQLLSHFWTEFETNPTPKEFYSWSGSGVPMQTYFAAPVADASNAVSRFTDFVLGKAGALFATNDMVKFQRAKAFNGLEWKGVPYISPFVRSTEASGQGFIVAGFFPLVGTNQPLTQQLLARISDHTNLVYYDWESTGPRIEQWTYIAQLLRLFMGRPQLPGNSAAGKWLESMSKRLGPCSTEIIRNSDREFSFTRLGSLPFTAIELQLLIDWTESPEFPSRDASALFNYGGR
jgi:hypothetical protein